VKITAAASAADCCTIRQLNQIIDITARNALNVQRT